MIIAQRFGWLSLIITLLASIGCTTQQLELEPSSWSSFEDHRPQWQKDIRTVVDDHRPLIRQCLNNGSEAFKKKMKLVYEWEIRPSGEVAFVRFAEEKSSMAPFETQMAINECLLGQIRDWQFSQIRQPHITRKVSFPFIYVPADGANKTVGKISAGDEDHQKVESTGS